MALSVLLLVGLAVVIFVGLNVGGSSAGVSFGPAVGSEIISYRKASFLMGTSAIAGGVIIGPNVVETLGRGIVPSENIGLLAAILILCFAGAGILIGNILKISSSTSQVAVGSIAGMGAAFGALNIHLIETIFVWWIASSILAFWVSATVGRYLYKRIVQFLSFENESRRAAKVAVIAVGCYMAFSAGASNVGNAVAPLVGSGSIPMFTGVLLGGLAMLGGALLIGPRTMKTVGKDITHLSLESALIVELIAATEITLMSQAGIPASLAVVATMSVIGLGWGRATRRIPLKKELGLQRKTSDDIEIMKEDDPHLYRRGIVKRIVLLWLGTPVLACVSSFLVFRIFSFFGQV